MRFATRGADKFDGAGFTPDADGLPVLADVSVSLRCTAHSKVDGGDHLVLMGQVEEVTIGDEMPFVYFRRKFHSLETRGDQAADSDGRILVPVVIDPDIGWM